MITKLKKYFNNKSKKVEENKKVVFVKFPPKCLTCEKEMDSLKMNKPFCKECSEILKGLIKEKK